MNLARRIISAAAWLAPSAHRDDFRHEWQAELAWGQSSGRPSWGLMRHTLGAFVHALWLRKEQWRFEMLMQDLRYAWRVLSAQKSFTIVAALTLALGIGANAAIFSIVYGVLLKPLPLHEPDRLVHIFETNPLRNWTTATASPANLMDWKARNRTLEDIAFYPSMENRAPMFSSGNLQADGAEPERLRGLRVSFNMFRALGVQPMLGRDFLESEQVPGKNRVAILSHALWTSHFGADPNIVGRDVQVNMVPYRVVGVMPRSFTFPDARVQLWTPYAVDASFLEQRRPHFLRPVARLRPGLSIAQAREDLQRIAADLEKEYPDTNTKMGIGVASIQDWMVGDVRTALVLFMAAVGLVLLIACANLANLLLARASGRARELAVRSALGASGWRIARQMLTENLLLAVLGAGLGILIARWTLGAIITASPVDLPRLDEVSLDWRALAFVASITALTTLFIGALPAWVGAHASSTALRDGVRTTGGGSLTRRVLVVTQVAASVALLVCAGLLLRSFERLNSVPPGFDPNGVVAFQLTLPGVKYSEEPQVVAFWEALLPRLRALPGVSAAGAATVIGLEGRGWTGDLFVEGRPGFQGRELGHKDITPGYFAAMGLRIVRGRDLADTDITGAPPVAVVNDAFVRAYFADEDPIGKRISYARVQTPDTWRTIVGIVSDEKQESLATAVYPQVYESHRQNAASGMTIVVRSSLPETSLMPALRQEVRSLDAGLAVFNVRTLQDVVATSVARERFTAALVALFAGLALAIASIGVYGVIAYSVSRRTREIGVRVALGAERRGVLWLVTRETLALVGAGMLGGFAAAAVMANAIRGMLFQVSPADPLTYLAVIAVLAGVALAATYVPARRALAVDPMTALRSE